MPELRVCFRYHPIRKSVTGIDFHKDESYCRLIDDAVDLTNLSQPERMQHVLRLLETRDYVQVAELSQAFAVSEVTVRSDLGQLARQGLVARIRGGARARQHGASEGGFALRVRREVDAKRAVARAGAARVHEGEAGAPDASTTPVCTFGADQTCNDDPRISSIRGRCTDAGACACGDAETNPDSGRCL